MRKISLATARRLALAAQGLDGRWKLPPGCEGVAQTVDRLGHVQIDTISVVCRAHHHTLWARRSDYRPEMLHQLQATDRRVFEYWAPAASYLPMAAFRFYVRRLPGYLDGFTERFLAENRTLVREVLGRIRREGPLGSADFKHPTGRKRSGWWDWKPAKHALECLFNVGELMVSERRNFQRRYDLTERVLPPDVDTTPPGEIERARFLLRRALRAQGVSGLNHWSMRRRGKTADALDELIDAGEVTPVEVRGADGEFFALTDALAAGPRRAGRRKLHILSPFDGLVRHRGQLRLLFGFEHKLEAYTPAAKRKWGYFCLPILWGEAFLGRLDAKADRKARVLRVLQLLFEPGLADADAALAPLAGRLAEFAAFNGCDNVEIEQTRPARLRAAIRRELKARADP